MKEFNEIKHDQQNSLSIRNIFQSFLKELYKIQFINMRNVTEFEK